jgi:hypothetical protein
MSQFTTLLHDTETFFKNGLDTADAVKIVTDFKADASLDLAAATRIIGYVEGTANVVAKYLPEVIAVLPGLGAPAGAIAALQVAQSIVAAIVAAEASGLGSVAQIAAFVKSIETALAAPTS